MEPKMIYITCSDREEAMVIGRALVEARLVACINLIPGMESVYWWKDEICSDREMILIAKTMGDRVPDLIEMVRDLHSYDVPCIISLPIESGNPEYLQWIGQSVQEA